MKTMRSMTKAIIYFLNDVKMNIAFLAICSCLEYIFFKHDFLTATFVMVMVIWGYNILFSLTNWSKNIVFLMFNFMFFLFLLSRPFLNMINYGQVWYYPEQAYRVANVILYLSLVLLFIGYRCLDYVIQQRPPYQDQPSSGLKKYGTYLRYGALGLFFICWLCSMYNGFDMIMFMRGRTYEDFYTQYHSSVPFVVNALAQVMPYFLCCYLMTFPSKIKTYIILIIYLLSGLPDFIIGSRGTIMEAAVFCFVYFALRHYLETKSIQWIGKFEKLMLVISIPVIILGLGAYNYIRAKEDVPQINPMYLMTDFFYKQGTSADTLCQSIQHQEALRNSQHINYTFGEIIDTTLHGTIAQRFFHATDLGSGNNLTKAYTGNYVTHHLSYLVLKERYLAGQGRGTSYVIENYIDFGYGGVVIFNLLLGMYLSSITYFMKKHIFIATIAFIPLTKIFEMARQPSMRAFLFLFTPHFWIAVIMLLCTVCLCSMIFNQRRRYRYGKIY